MYKGEWKNDKMYSNGFMTTVFGRRLEGNRQTGIVVDSVGNVLDPSRLGLNLS